jgi:hypothetical protein
MAEITKVESAKFVAIAEKLGLKVTRQSSNFRIEDESGARRLYVPTTTKVHRIDISGFTHDLGLAWDVAFPGKAPPTGKVQQVLNFAQEERLVLKDAFKVMKTMSKAAAEGTEPVEEQPVAEEPSVALEQAPEAEAVSQ